ncbi:MAG: TPM domain-containing protein, partial [Nanoarchaeota archaeon]
MKRLIFLILFLVIVQSVHAQYPTVTKTVTDFAGILSSSEEQALGLMIDNIKQKTSVEIAVVTINTTNGDDRINFAARIGEQSGIGKKGSDNGIVILYSLENEKGGAIATGRGIESTLNDAKVARIGRDSKQYFDTGEYAKGFGTIIEGISAELVIQGNI